MEYKFLINDFEGPLDLLLHLIKKNNVDICDIKISDITKQYLDYLEEMENLDLNIASEYLALAAELIEMKSLVLLPKPEFSDDEYEEDPRENLIKRLIEYKKIKESTPKYHSIFFIYVEKNLFLLAFCSTSFIICFNNFSSILITSFLMGKYNNILDTKNQHFVPILIYVLKYLLLKKLTK